MKTSIREERLIVVSDIHLGNRLFPAARRHLSRLIQHAKRSGYSLCINGDGVDIMQMSIGLFTRELADCARALRDPSHPAPKLFYVVGNHDIIIEHFLEDWGSVVTVPFLNVHSGDLRVRIDHGHIYDAMFVRFPRLYGAATMVGRRLISFSPRLYTAVESAASALNAGSRHVRGGPQPALSRGAGEPARFLEIADEISRRGFDVVTFGHTHVPGEVRLPSGARYFNTGSWLNDPYCVVLDHGQVSFGPVSQLLEGAAQ
jgi:UDP-2,3-diacylglucosamine pyrophosphatase LpxH